MAIQTFMKVQGLVGNVTTPPAYIGCLRVWDWSWVNPKNFLRGDANSVELIADIDHSPDLYRRALEDEEDLKFVDIRDAEGPLVRRWVVLSGVSVFDYRKTPGSYHGLTWYRVTFKANKGSVRT